jgi:hypothetical protein
MLIARLPNSHRQICELLDSRLTTAEWQDFQQLIAGWQATQLRLADPLVTPELR